MRTTLSFGDDAIEIANIAIGQPNDHCSADIAELRNAIEGDGVSVEEEFSLSCDAPPASAANINTAGAATEQKRARAQQHRTVGAGG